MWRSQALTCLAAATCIQVAVSAQQEAMAVRSAVIQTWHQVQDGLYMDHCLLTDPGRKGHEEVDRNPLPANSASLLPTGSWENEPRTELQAPTDPSPATAAVKGMAGQKGGSTQTHGDSQPLTSVGSQVSPTLPSHSPDPVTAICPSSVHIPRTFRAQELQGEVPAACLWVGDDEVGHRRGGTQR